MVSSTEDALIIKTALDPSGFEAGSKALKSAIASLSKTAKNLGNSIKRIVPSILGVGSAFQIITKAANTFMSQNEELTQRMSAAWTSLGNLIGPIIEQIVGWITTAIQHLTAFLKLLGMTGKTSTQTGKAAAKTAATVKKSVEEIRRTLAGFDELNVLQDNDKPDQDQSGGADTSTPATLPDIEPPDWMRNLAELLKSGQFEEFGRELARMLNEAIKNVPWDELGHKVSTFFLGVLKSLYGAIDEFDWRQLGQSIKTFFLNIQWAEIRQQIFELLKSAWKGAVNLLWGFMAEDDSTEPPPLIKSLQNLGNSLAGLYKAIDDFIQMAWKSELKPVLEWTTDTGLPWLVDRLKDGVDLLAKLIENHGPLILGILESIGAAVLGWKIGVKVAALIEKVSALWAVLMAHPILLIIAAVATLVVAIAKYGDEIKAKLQKLDDFLKNVFAKDWREVFGPVLGTILNGFSDSVKQCWDSIKQVFDGIIDFIRGVFTGNWERAWTGVKEVFAGIFSGLEYILKAPINGIISLVNGAIAGINQLIDGANRLGSVVGFSIPYLNEIPYLAKGGVLKRGQLALLEGEGAEAVVPLEKNTEWIRKVAEQFMEQLAPTLEKRQFKTDSGVSAEATFPREQKMEWLKTVFEQVKGQLEPLQDMKQIAALQDIASTINFQASGIAGGAVLPYSVQAGGEQGRGDNSDLLTVLERIDERLNDIDSQMDNIQFVAQFDNLRALAKRITQEQRKQARAEGI